MEGLMNRLNISIPPWILRRRVRVSCRNHKKTDKSRIVIESLDPDNVSIPYTFFQSIEVTIGDGTKQELDDEPFFIEISNENDHPILIRFNFFGHYGEIPFDLHYINVKHVPNEEQFYLFYNHLKGEWRKTIDETNLPI